MIRPLPREHALAVTAFGIRCKPAFAADEAATAVKYSGTLYMIPN
jgi:hypothetical protein